MCAPSATRNRVRHDWALLLETRLEPLVIVYPFVGRRRCSARVCAAASSKIMNLNPFDQFVSGCKEWHRLEPRKSTVRIQCETASSRERTSHVNKLELSHLGFRTTTNCAKQKIHGCCGGWLQGEYATIYRSSE